MKSVFKYFVSVLAVFLIIVTFIATSYGVFGLVVHTYEWIGFNNDDAVDLTINTGLLLFISLVLGLIVNEFW
ncbi:hypothetical protein MT339_09110 [Staphylococcus sp. NRL 19/737]|nr:hypothetical protein [Staphylococcus sp. NRL 19/737]MCJ1668555.1 hypothetical protein [Staphylococcus sp. NRL 19/737]